MLLLLRANGHEVERLLALLEGGNCKLLRQALGTNALARQEKWVDLVMAFSALDVTVKLAATTLPWSIRLAAAFMLASWSSVQLLLVCFHLEELEEVSWMPTIHVARRYRDLITHRGVTVAITLAILPILVYFGYVAGFQITAEKTGTALPLWSQLFFLMCQRLGMIVPPILVPYFIYSIISFRFLTYFGLPEPGSGDGMVTVLAIVTSLFLFLGLLIAYGLWTLILAWQMLGIWSSILHWIILL